MATETEKATTKRYRTVCPHIIQNFVLLWLDENIVESAFDGNIDLPLIVQLRQIINTLCTFNNPDDCIDFLTDVEEEKVFMVISDCLNERIIPLVHDIPQLHSIFIFSGNDHHQADHSYWMNEMSKVKGIFTQVDPIMELLKKVARECDENYTSISFIPNDGSLNRNLDQLDQSFMYSQILKEILFEIEYDIEYIEEFTTYCREKYKNNQAAVTVIDKFEEEYFYHLPTWWYTYPCFIFSMLNRALRVLETDTIVKIGFFIRDLHRHIVELHSEQQTQNQVRPFMVYRGQGMTKMDFEKMLKSKGGLISFNNFLSTTKDYDVAYAVADSNRGDSDLIGILFQMSIDPAVSTAPFALLDDTSYFEDSEQEILFSMHTIFRINDMKPVHGIERFWKVELTLTKNNDKEIITLTELMRKETKAKTGWDRLSQMWIRLGEYDRAEREYRDYVELVFDWESKAHMYHQLGYLMIHKANYTEALSFFQKSVEIYQKMRSPRDLRLRTSYNNMGIVYQEMGSYEKALSFYEQALEIAMENLPPDDPDIAFSYHNMGELFNIMGEHSKALSFYDKALEIRKKTLSAYDPALASTYGNIGAVYNDLGDHVKALSFNYKALTIHERVLPPDHPDLATTYNNIGLSFGFMKDYSNALPFYIKSLNISERKLPPDHPDLAHLFYSIGNACIHIGEYLQAILWFEKKLAIVQKHLPLDHFDIAVTHQNIGFSYMELDEYTKALSFFEKTLEIFEKVPPPSDRSLATVYKHISMIYDKLGEHLKAISFQERADAISESSTAESRSDIRK